MQSVKRHRQDTSSSGTWLGKMVDGLKDTLSVLRRSELFAKLAVVMMVSGIVFECIQDLLFNYLIITMGFGASDNARILMTIGLCGLAVQVPPLSRLLGSCAGIRASPAGEQCACMCDSTYACVHVCPLCESRQNECQWAA